MSSQHTNTRVQRLFFRLSSRVPPWYAHILSFIALVYTGLSFLTYTGIYRWVAEVQFWLFGVNTLELSVVLTLMLSVFAVFGIGAGLVAAGLLRPATSQQVEAKLVSATPALDRNRRLKLWEVGACIAILGAALLIAGGGTLLRIPEEKSPTDLSIASPAATSAAWLHVHAPFELDGTVSYGDRRSQNAYVPCVDPVSNRVVCVLRYPHKAPGDHGSLVLDATGIRHPVGLAGPVRAAMERMGLDASEAVTVCVGDRPDDWRSPAELAAYGGAGLLLIGGAIAAGGYLRGRRAGARQTP